MKSGLTMQNRIGRPLLASVLLSTAAGAWAVQPGEDGLSLGAQFGVIRDDNPLLIPIGLDDAAAFLHQPKSELTPHADTIR